MSKRISRCAVCGETASVLGCVNENCYMANVTLHPLQYNALQSLIKAARWNAGLGDCACRICNAVRRFDKAFGVREEGK